MNSKTTPLTLFGIEKLIDTNKQDLYNATVHVIVVAVNIIRNAQTCRGTLLSSYGTSYRVLCAEDQIAIGLFKL